MTNQGAASAFSTWEQSAPAAHDAEADLSRGQTAPEEGVGLVRLSHEEREAAIKRAGEAMERAYADFAATGKPEDLERAYRHLTQMRELVKGRDPEVVARMESERGLSRA